MEEAQEAFGVEFDALPPPAARLARSRSVWRVDLDAVERGGERRGTEDNSRRLTAAGSSWTTRSPGGVAPSVYFPSLAFTLWLRSADFHQRRREAAEQIERLLADNPHTTLQVVLEPTGDPERLTAETLESLLAACYRTTTYLDRYYSLQPGPAVGLEAAGRPAAARVPAERVVAALRCRVCDVGFLGCLGRRKWNVAQHSAEALSERFSGWPVSCRCGNDLRLVEFEHRIQPILGTVAHRF